MASSREQFPQTVHAILKTALAAARPEDRPPQPWHLGGPRPVCPARAQVSLAVTLARLFSRRVNAGNRRQFESTLTAVDRYLAGSDPGDTLRSLANQSSGKDLALGIARNAVGAAATLARGKPDLVSSGAQAAAAKAIALAGPGAPARGLLEALDQEIIRAECSAAFLKAAQSRPIERVLWRAPDEREKTVHWIVRLEGGSCGALMKLVARKAAAWTEGSLNDVIALVPAAQFAPAVEHVMREFQKPTIALAALSF